MGRRTLTLISSIVTAAVGTALVAGYVRSAETRAEHGATLVRVLTAQKDVPAGTTVAAAEGSVSFGLGEVLRRQVRDGDTVVSLAQLDDIRGWVATGPILVGQPIQRRMFRSPDAAAPTGLAAGRMGVSVQLGDPNRVAAFIRENSRVAVFVTLGQDGAGGRTRLLLPEVRVLGVGDAAAARQVSRPATGSVRSPESVPTTIVTLDVDQREAQKIIFAARSGELHLALLGENVKGSPTLGDTNLGNLFE